MPLLGQELQFSELEKEFLLARVIKLYGGFAAVIGLFHFGYGAYAKTVVNYAYSRRQI